MFLFSIGFHFFFFIFLFGNLALETDIWKGRNDGNKFHLTRTVDYIKQHIEGKKETNMSFGLGGTHFASQMNTNILTAHIMHLHRPKTKKSLWYS